MKTRISIVALIATFGLLITSCGSSTPENDVLGKVPGCYRESSNLKKEFREWARGQNDAEKIISKEKELKAKQQALAEKAGEAARSLMDKEVPFSNPTANPDFEVINVILSEYNGKGCFTARAYVKAAREMQLVRFARQITTQQQVAMTDNYIYYVLLTADNTGIALGKINPFSDRPALGVSLSNVFELNEGDVIQAGENLTQMGSPITLNCEMYDMTDFATVKFISAQDYRNLGGM